MDSCLPLAEDLIIFCLPYKADLIYLLDVVDAPLFSSSNFTLHPDEVSFARISAPTAPAEPHRGRLKGSSAYYVDQGQELDHG